MVFQRIALNQLQKSRPAQYITIFYSFFYLVFAPSIVETLALQHDCILKYSSASNPLRSLLRHSLACLAYVALLALVATAHTAPMQARYFVVSRNFRHGFGPPVFASQICIRPFRPMATPNGTRAASGIVTSTGDLNNVSAMRITKPVITKAEYAYRSLAIPVEEDDADVRKSHRPFILADNVTNTDWISQLELAKAAEMSHESMASTGERLKVLVLYGSLRSRYASFRTSHLLPPLMVPS